MRPPDGVAATVLLNSTRARVSGEAIPFATGGEETTELDWLCVGSASTFLWMFVANPRGFHCYNFRSWRFTSIDGADCLAGSFWKSFNKPEVFLVFFWRGDV